MKLDIDHADIHLEQAQAMRISGAMDVSVACLNGCLWITQDNDPRDIVLERGESFTLDRPGVAILFACKPTTLSMRDPALLPQVKTEWSPLRLSYAP